MIAHVAARASESAASEVIVATDDERVLREAAVESLMTRTDHVSGSDRVMEVAASRGWPDDHVVVNVQGDEPLIPPVVIDQVAQLLDGSAEVGVATLSEPLHRASDISDENIVKVVVTRNGRALYFSRAPIPYARGGFSVSPGDSGGQWRRHIGIYAYRVTALRRFVALPVGRLEATESLEQLRFLENDIGIAVEEAVAPVPGGVDTPADLERVRRAFRESPAGQASPVSGSEGGNGLSGL